MFAQSRRLSGYKLKAVVANVTRAQVEKVTLKLFKLEGTGVVCDRARNLYVADFSNHNLRRVR